MWSVIFEGFDPEGEMLRETLCTLGNGFFCTRGSVEWVSAEAKVHYPGTYLAGGYNRLESQVADRIIVNEDLVNVPNWLCLDIRPRDGAWWSEGLSDGTYEIVSWQQRLDLRIGMLDQTVRVRDAEGRETTLETRRIVSMHMKHLAGIDAEITPHNWSGHLEVRSALDGTVVNGGVVRYEGLANRHLVPLETGDDDDVVWLRVETNQSRLQVVEAARVRVFRNGAPIETEREVVHDEGYVAETVGLEVHRDAPVHVEKIVALYTSRDRAISEPGLEARNAARGAESFGELLHHHATSWSRLWRRCDVKLDFPPQEGDLPIERVQFLLRFHVFHLLQTVSPHTVDLDVGVPARGWHGEAYRGHVFWDELFILPFLSLRMPEISRALLRYRHRRIDQARELARKIGHAGACYPWQSGSNGVEETQVVHLNPKSGRWIPDASRLQRHVNAALVYNVWQYWRMTGDYDFLHVHGAEMILEIARFWADQTQYDPAKDRYEIHGVMGPDEYHEGYPDADEPGLRNNAYTNVMAAWCADVALTALDELVADRRAELSAAIGLTNEEIALWGEMRHKMYVPFHKDDETRRMVISQFEGYEDLEEFDWDSYRGRYGNIMRLDRILEAEGDTTDRYKLSKQADVLMLAYLFTDTELREIFERLGYPLEADTMLRNYRYYCPRTAHGSTLSNVVHAALALRYDPLNFDRDIYRDALRADIDDIQGGTTREGIHLGAMAATVDVMTRYVFGLEIRDDHVSFNPMVAYPGVHLEFPLRFRRKWFDVAVRDTVLSVRAREDGEPLVQIGLRDRVFDLEAGKSRDFDLTSPSLGLPTWNREGGQFT